MSDDPQPTFFSGADVPVAVGLILDNSSSMIARQGMLIAGGAAFARSSHENDELFTIHFNEHIQFGLPGGTLEEARAHDAHADARAERAEADDQADADPGGGLDRGDQLQLVHLAVPFGLRKVYVEKARDQWCSCAIEMYTMVSIMKM